MPDFGLFQGVLFEGWGIQAHVRFSNVTVLEDTLVFT